MIDAFLKYLQYEKRLSSHTVLAYQTDLQQFQTFLTDTFREVVETADYGMIRSWIVNLVESGLDPRSVNRKIACLRTFYKFLRRNEVIKADPMIKIRVLKTQKKLPSFVKDSEMSSLLNGDVFEPNFAGTRDRLIIELFYGTGIRLSELLTLKEIDVDEANRTIKVLGKRNKERVVPFSPLLAEIIHRYRAEKKSMSFETDSLVVGDNGSSATAPMVYRTVKKYLKLFTNAEKKSPHVLRHTYATHLLNNGAEINAVKDLLGHSSLAATQVYTHNSMDKLKKVFEQAHPKA